MQINMPSLKGWLADLHACQDPGLNRCSRESSAISAEFKAEFIDAAILMSGCRFTIINCKQTYLPLILFCILWLIHLQGGTQFFPVCNFLLHHVLGLLFSDVLHLTSDKDKHVCLTLELPWLEVLWIYTL